MPPIVSGRSKRVEILKVIRPEPDFEISFGIRAMYFKETISTRYNYSHILFSLGFKCWMLLFSFACTQLLH